MGQKGGSVLPTQQEGLDLHSSRAGGGGGGREQERVIKNPILDLRGLDKRNNKTNIVEAKEERTTNRRQNEDIYPKKKRKLIRQRRGQRTITIEVNGISRIPKAGHEPIKGRAETL